MSKPKMVYVVEISTTFPMCVIASDQDEARKVARKNAHYEYSNVDADWDISVGGAARSLDDVPSEWHDALPYVAEGAPEPEYVEAYFKGEASVEKAGGQ